MQPGRLRARANRNRIVDERENDVEMLNLDEETMRAQRELLERIEQENRDMEIARRLQEQVNEEFAAERAEAPLSQEQVDAILGPANPVVPVAPAVRVVANIHYNGINRRRPHSPEIAPHRMVAIRPRLTNVFGDGSDGSTSEDSSSGDDEEEDEENDNDEDIDEDEEEDEVGSSSSSGSETEEEVQDDSIQFMGVVRPDGEHDDSDDIQSYSSDDELELNSDGELFEVVPLENLQPLMDDDARFFNNERELFDLEPFEAPNANDRAVVAVPEVAVPLENVTTEYGDCTLCLENPSNATGCVICRQLIGCKSCVDRWYNAAPRNGGHASCPLCRCRWKSRPRVALMSKIVNMRPRRRRPAGGSA